MEDYKNRTYLSTGEVAQYLGIRVKEVHSLIQRNEILSQRSTSGQLRLKLIDIKKVEELYNKKEERNPIKEKRKYTFDIHNTKQSIYCANSQSMNHLPNDSIHLVITSPPYFNAKLYSNLNNDLGNIHDVETWILEIKKVWKEVFRVLQPGRKFFLNIMNLPIREKGSFRTLNLVGKNITICEEVGFIFKRDIIWHKTNGVRAHFGSFPYPGGILINNMHEFILEFEKPIQSPSKKYIHLSKEIREKSKLDKDFWLSLKNSDVWLINPEKSGDGRDHIAPFPLELPYRLIKGYSYIGENVMDPFLGGGTTLSAAINARRNGFGYELNPKYFLLAKNKLQIESESSIT